MSKQKLKNILICWHSKNNGVPVLLNCLQMLHEQEGIEIDVIYYLQNEDFDDTTLACLEVCQKRDTHRVPEDEKHHLKKVKEFFYQHESIEFPSLIQKRLHLKKVTDYQSIYAETRKWLDEISSDLANVQVHINLSPGMPQSQTVWLVLNSAGYLPINVRLWSSQKDKKRNKHSLEEIRFKPKHQLSNLFEGSYQRKLSEEVTIDVDLTSSPKRKKSEELIELFAATPPSPILLLGERGTGKSTYIEQIIYKKFYEPQGCEYRHIPCGIFSPELMRSELFGHVKGAFTDAIQDKKGLIEAVKDNGLLFLDEIHDLDKPLQRQLMIILQTGEYMPVGYEGKPKKAQFRLVTASNLPLSELMHRLDPDFFDRIAHYIVEVPSLRESKEDYALYWQEIWKQRQPDMPMIWNDTIQSWLYNCEFPNNFRGVQQVVGYFCAFLKGESVHNWEKAWNRTIDYYQEWEEQKSSTTQPSYFQEGRDYQEIMADIEYDLAKWAIFHYGGEESAALHLKRGLSTIRGYLSKNRLKRDRER